MPNYIYGMLKDFQLYIRKQIHWRGLRKNTFFRHIKIDLNQRL